MWLEVFWDHGEEMLQQQAYAGIADEYVSSLNEGYAGKGIVQSMLAVWIAACTKKENVIAFVDEQLQKGLPVMGRRDQSKVIRGRAAKKWVKATKTIREIFGNVTDYKRAVVSAVFDYLPFVAKKIPIFDTREVFTQAKKGMKDGKLTASHMLNPRARVHTHSSTGVLAMCSACLCLRVCLTLACCCCL